jgi:hypothetical protein
MMDEDTPRLLLNEKTALLYRSEDGGETWVEIAIVDDAGMETLYNASDFRDRR